MYSEQFGLGPQSAEAIAPATISEAGPPPQKSRWAAQLRRIVREPLTHFLILGIAIFIAAHVVEERSTRFRIAIAQPELNRIVASYTQQYGSEPTPDQLRTMVDNYVREEIFLREGIALGLDRNDEIVRRRIAQKYDFLQQDNAVAREPSESQLRSWFAAHPADFRRPVRRSFEQLYFAADARGDAAARQRAEAARAVLQAGGKPPAADEFPGPKTISELSLDDATRLFGADDFAKAVFAAPVGQWSGPLRSGFGWHVIRVTQERAASKPSFDEVRADVRNAWRDADQRARNAEIYRQLRARYTVTVAGAPL